MKKSLTKTEFYDSVLKTLIKKYDWDPAEFDRKDAQAIVEAVLHVAISHSMDKNGCIIPGIGKVFFHEKKATKKRKMKNNFTGKMQTIEAKPAMMVPKLRINKAFKDKMNKFLDWSKKKGKRKK